MHAAFRIQTLLIWSEHIETVTGSNDNCNDRLPVWLVAMGTHSDRNKRDDSLPSQPIGKHDLLAHVDVGVRAAEGTGSEPTHT